jgi:hypothetical protein
LDERRIPEAQAALERSLQIDPRQVPAMFDLGVLRTTRSDWAGARALWEQVIAVDPYYPNARVLLSRLPQQN